HIWPVEKAFVTPEFVADGTRLAIAEMLRGGTTCFNDMYFFPDVTAEIAAEVGMRACIGLPIYEMSTAWAAPVDEYFEKGLALLDRGVGADVVQYAIAPAPPSPVPNGTLEPAAEVSRRYRVPMHMHLLETESEAVQSLEEHGCLPLQRLDGLG